MKYPCIKTFSKDGLDNKGFDKMVNSFLRGIPLESGLRIYPNNCEITILYWETEEYWEK